MFCFSCCKKELEPIYLLNGSIYPPQMSEILGGLSDTELENFVENSLIKESYTIIEGIGSGNHWKACRARKKSNYKSVIIKKISKAKIPVAEQYFQPCDFTPNCLCTRCSPHVKTRPPLELILLLSKSNTLPEFVQVIEDDTHYYLITKCHGVSKVQFEKIWTWFGSSKWWDVNWVEYFT